MFFIGGFFALLIRLELLTPAGDLVLADTYNKLFSMHGQIMVFFFLVPSIPATLGNFLIPMMVGAKDLAFPRINLLSWYLYIIAGGIYVHCILTGGVDTGWTFYTPFSTAFSNTKVIEAGLAIFVVRFSSILTGLNFVVTVHRMRAPGMTWSRLPLFVWSHLCNQHYHAFGDARTRHYSFACRLRESFQSGDFRSRLAVAILFCSSTYSGSTRILPSTS